MSESILELKNVKKYFYQKQGLFGLQKNTVKAVNDVSFSVERGKTTAIVGESGSGKSTLANLIMKFEDITEGDISYNGQSILSHTAAELDQYRKEVQMVFQDPSSSLNPRRSLGEIIEEPMVIHGFGNKKERKDRALHLLTKVGLSEDFYNRYQHTLSGGQKQRIGIARAIALDSELILLDEPTSGLDVSVQAVIIDLLQDLQDEMKVTYFFITHDLALVKNMADNVVVMNNGRIVESGTVEEIFSDPKDAYTKKLIKAIPVISEVEALYLQSL